MVAYGSQYQIGTQKTHVLTMRNVEDLNPEQPLVRITPIGQSIVEGQPLRFRISRAGGGRGAVSGSVVAYETCLGPDGGHPPQLGAPGTPPEITCQRGNFLQEKASQAVSIGEGQTNSEIYQFETYNDENIESNGRLTLELTLDNARAQNTHAHVIIRDNDEARLWISTPTQANEGDAITFVVGRSSAHRVGDLSITVAYDVKGSVWNGQPRPRQETRTMRDGETQLSFTAITLPRNDLSDSASHIRARILPSRSYELYTEDDPYYIPTGRGSAPITATATSGWVRISDDDVFPLTLSGPETVVEGRSATYTLHRDGLSNYDYNVYLFIITTSPVHPQILENRVVRFPRNSRAARFSVASIDDVYNLGDGSIQVGIETFVNGIGYVYDYRAITLEEHRNGLISSVTTTVTDNDTVSRPPTVSLSRLTSSIQEGYPARFRVRRSGSSRFPLGVSLWINETGEMYRDYCKNHPNLERVESRIISIPITPLGVRECRIHLFIPAGKSSIDLSIPTYTNNKEEDNSTITVEVSNDRQLYYKAGSANRVSVLVRDHNPGAATIRMEPYTGNTELDEGEAITFRISRVPPLSSSAVWVRLEVDQSNERPIANPPTGVRIPNGKDHVDVRIETDSNDTPHKDGKVTLHLLDDEGDKVGETSTPEKDVYNISGGIRSFMVNVNNDDPYIKIPAGPYSVTEGQEFTLQLQAHGLTNESVTVAYATEDGQQVPGTQIEGAKAGTDYTAANGSLVFNASSGTHTITVATLADQIDDGGEEFLLKLSSSDIYFESPGSGPSFVNQITLNVTINNDGPLPRAWVAAFAHSAGTSVVDSILDRLDNRDSNAVWFKLIESHIDESGTIGTNKGAVVGYDESNEIMTLGLAFGSFSADGKYGKHELGGDLNGLFPYVEWRPNEVTRLWGVVGQGFGTIAVDETEADLQMQLGATGIKFGVIDNEQIAIDTYLDTLWISSESDNTSTYRAVQTETWRHRAGVDVAYHLTDQVDATANLEYGHEGGDIEGDEYLEGTLGLAYSDERLQLALGVGVRNPHEAALDVGYQTDDWKAVVSVAGSDDLDVSTSFSYNLPKSYILVLGWAGHHTLGLQKKSDLYTLGLVLDMQDEPRYLFDSAVRW